MRSTKELMAELDAEAANVTNVALAVGFESTTIFVFSHEPDRLQALNDAIRAGGEPIGFLAYEQPPEQHEVHVKTRVLAEYAEEPWATGYLRKLAENTALLAEARYGTKGEA